MRVEAGEGVDQAAQNIHWMGMQREKVQELAHTLVDQRELIEQIREDHNNAKFLADGIANIKGLTVDRESIKSNILYFDLEKGHDRSEILASQTVNKDQYPFDIILNDVYFLETSPDRFRLVTHYGITMEHVKETLNILQDMIN